MFNKTQMVVLTAYSVVITAAWIYILGWWFIPVMGAAAVCTWAWAQYDDRVLFDLTYSVISQSALLLGFASLVNPVGALVLVACSASIGLVLSRWSQKRFAL